MQELLPESLLRLQRSPQPMCGELSTTYLNDEDDIFLLCIINYVIHILLYFL